MANFLWTEEETLKLIELWSEDVIQEMLEGSKRNKDVYAKIAKELEREGYKKSGEQCNSKIKRLRFEYKKIKDNRRKTGRGRKEWKFYEALDMILGHKPSTQPPVVIESAGCSSLTNDQEPYSPCPSTPSSLNAANASDEPQEDGVCGGDEDGLAGSADVGESSQSLGDERGVLMEGKEVLRRERGDMTSLNEWRVWLKR